MDKRRLASITGVLGNLTSREGTTEPAQPADVQPEQKPDVQPPTASAESEDKTPANRVDEPAKQAPAARTFARQGRRPGRKSGESKLKRKTTIWVTAELIDEYRDWSWEELCGFGELVERALVEYKQRRKPDES